MLQFSGLIAFNKKSEEQSHFKSLLLNACYKRSRQKMVDKANRIWWGRCAGGDLDRRPSWTCAADILRAAELQVSSRCGCASVVHLMHWMEIFGREVNQEILIYFWPGWAFVGLFSRFWWSILAHLAWLVIFNSRSMHTLVDNLFVESDLSVNNISSGCLVWSDEFIKSDSVQI